MKVTSDMIPFLESNGSLTWMLSTGRVSKGTTKEQDLD